MSIFVSYSRKQFYYAESLFLCLQSHGIPIWFDVQRLKGGIEWEQSIQNELRACDGLILIASKSALASEYVRGEWQTVLAAHKPVYVVLFEKVVLPHELVNAPVIDGRNAFENQMRFLAQLISRPPQHLHYQQKIKNTRFSLFPSHLSLEVLLVASPLWLCLSGAFAGLTIETINALHELLFVYSHNATARTGIIIALLASIVSYLFFTKYTFYYLTAFLGRRSFNIYGFQYFSLLLFVSCIIPGFLATHAVQIFLPPSLANTLFAQDLASVSWGTGLSMLGGFLAFMLHLFFFTSDVIFLWLPPGAAPVDARVERNRQWHTTRQELPGQKRAVTYKLYFEPDDVIIAEDVKKALRAQNHREVVSQEADYHIFILTNRTPIFLFHYALNIARPIICIAGSSVAVPGHWQAFHRLQWVDYRAWQWGSLSKLASDLCLNQSTAQNYDFPVLPETLEKLVVPSGIARVCMLFRLSAALCLGVSLVLLSGLWVHVLLAPLLQILLFLFLLGSSFFLFLLANRTENRDASRGSRGRDMLLALCGIGISDWLYLLIASAGNISNVGSTQFDAAGFITFGFSLFFLIFCAISLGDDKLINATWPPATDERQDKWLKDLRLSTIKGSFWHTTGFYLALGLLYFLTLLAQVYQSFHVF